MFLEDSANMSKDKILMIEDDTDIAELVEFNLQKEGYLVYLCNDGEEGIKQAQQLHPSLIVLDLMLPTIDGLSICRRLKANISTQNIPIIMLTAKSEESDIVVGLEMGADDYITKPFSPKELIARVRAVLRRPKATTEQNTPPSQHEQRKVGPISIDEERHEVYLNSLPLQLTLAEYRLLSALTSRPGRVFTREQLLEKITGGEAYVIDRNVDVHIRAIRKKLGEEADFIMTVRGVGYKCRD